MKPEKTRTYSELRQLSTFAERYSYLRLTGKVGEATFGRDRWLNQIFYGRNKLWKDIRREVIIRDLGCDLGIPGYEFGDKQTIIVHHMNPIMLEDLMDDERVELCLDPEFLITTSLGTHNAIHFGKDLVAPTEIIERQPNDTIPWRH